MPRVAAKIRPPHWCCPRQGSRVRPDNPCRRPGRDGVEAIEQTQKLRPDLVTMDVQVRLAWEDSRQRARS